jgi:hypothetical protein
MLSSTTSATESFAVHFQCPQPHRPDQPTIELTALLFIESSTAAPLIYASIFQYSPHLVAAIESLPCDLTPIKSFLSANSLPLLNVSAPWELEPIFIPKPWGQEIWYTGIEARGHASVKAGDGTVPLPWVLYLFPQAAENSLILLKVLDPLPDGIFGDLYFELHEKKQEVYIVTHIDSDAWPQGIGSIQLGFSAEKRAHYVNDTEFKNAYSRAVKDYEAVRRSLDAGLDGLRLLHGVDVNAPVAAEVLKQWIAELAQLSDHREAVKREQNLRQVMNSFVNDRPLRVGDTLAIPKHVPHALQHGVRVVEFQTPDYERKILSFAQKVLTQQHWDTDEALAIANMDYALAPPKVSLNADNICIEEIVNFDEFRVQRIRLDEGRYDLDSPSYALIMIITGELIAKWDGHHQVMFTGSAYLLPKSLARISFQSNHPCLFLRALPKQ